ncbi:MAG: hypothetical protein E7408_03380 [Ruminococcaceae bacterium]|nr:hypothetical protein [Oscillospiraceae bacterium]
MDFTGIYTALATPYDKDMQVNHKALEGLIEKNLEMGVSGFFVCGSSAEAFLLSPEERKEIMQIFTISFPLRKLRRILKGSQRNQRYRWLFIIFLLLPAYSLRWNSFLNFFP